MFNQKKRDVVIQNAKITALEFINYYKNTFADVDISLDYVNSDNEPMFEIRIPSLDVYRDWLSFDGMKGYLSGLKYYATEICKCKTETKTKK